MNRTKKNPLARYIVGAVFVTTLAPASLAAKTPDPLFLSDFQSKVGQICTYDIVHNGNKVRWQFEVSEASGDGLKASWTRVGDDPSESVPYVDVRTANGIKLTADLSMIHGTPMTASPGIQTFAFPLAPKKKWKEATEVSGTNSMHQSWKVSITLSSKAGRWKNVKTPAGDFIALEIATKGKISGLSANFKGKERATTWVGRGGCLVKKYQYSNSFNESASMILISENAP